MKSEVKMKRFASIRDDAAFDYGAGAFTWIQRDGVKHISFLYPQEFDLPEPHIGTSVGSVPVEHSPYDTHWIWNGDEGVPTLSPSIVFIVGGEETWHGFITEGVLQTT